MCIANEVNFFAHKEDKTSYNFVHVKLLKNIKEKKKSCSQQMKELHEGNRFFTPDEVKLLVDTCTMMDNMGLGIDTDTC